MNWKYLVIHHSATPDGKTFNFSEIRRYHTSYRIDYEIVPKHEYHARLKESNGEIFQRPWSDVGYHFAIENVCDEWEVIVGRPLTKEGAHCYQKDMNELGVGICFVGNYDIKKPEMSMILTAMNRLIIPLCHIFHIPYNYIIGHREVTGVKKSCPGKLFDMDMLRELVRHELK